MDKRDLSVLFRERLKVLLIRSGANQSAFAATVGIDRSALSQLLAGASTRLPRAETLLNIAAEHKVSLDWLLGLIPFIGAIPDFFFRSNTRNLRIVKRWLDRHHPETGVIEGRVTERREL